MFWAAPVARGKDSKPPPPDLASLLRKAADAHVHTLIVNTLAGEPMLTAGAVTVGDHREAVLCAAEWVATALGASRCWLAMDRADRARLKRAKSALRRKRVRIAPLVNRYPQHLPVLLAATITGVESPPGVNPMEAGVLVLQAETLIDLAAAMSWEQHRPAPVTHRVMTVTGPGVVRAGHYRIPIGTRFADVLCQTGVVGQIRRVVEGGSITGRAVDDLNVVVSRETSAMLVLDRGGDHVAAPGPCVQCGWCQEDCPVGLDPQRLLDLAERGDLAAAAGYYPQACIECGLCSYVCPAELPLAPTVMMLKAQVNTAKMRATR